MTSQYKHIIMIALCALSLFCVPSHAQQEGEIVPLPDGTYVQKVHVKTIQLTDSTYVRKARMEEVCAALPLLDEKTEIKDLYEMCQKCRKNRFTQCDVRIATRWHRGPKRFNEESHNKLEKLKITTSNIVNEETQRIIMAVGCETIHRWHNLNPIAKPQHGSTTTPEQTWSEWVKWCLNFLSKSSNQKK